MRVKSGLKWTGRLILRSVVVVSLLSSTALLSGCAEQEENRVLIDKQAHEVRQSINDVTNQGVSEKFNPLTVTDKVWAGDVATRIHRGVPLPPKFETERGITLVSAEPLSLSEIAAAITQQTGISVRVGDVNLPASSPASPAGLKSAPAPISPSPSVSLSGATMAIAFEGPLSGLLERVAGNYGVTWHYDGNTISVSKFETRVFSIEALPGTEKLSTDMTGGTASGGSSGGGGGSGTASAGGTATSSTTLAAKADMEIKYWDELKDNLTAMLAGTGTLVLSPYLGTVSVTTTPEIMQNIANYISMQNERLTKQIAINIEVFNLSLAKNEDFNITFSSFIRQMGQFGPTSLGGASAPAASTVQPLTSLWASANVAVINQGPGHFSISDVFKALSQIGDTTRVADFPMVTLNNRPVAVRVGQDIDYVASTNTTTSSGTGSSTVQTTATAGQINEGFTVHVIPRLLDDGRILLQYAITSVDLLSKEEFNSQCGDITNGSGACSTGGAGAGSATLELPKTANRSFLEQTLLRSGSTLVIAGESEKSINDNSQGVGDPFNYVFGGGSSASRQDSMILITITPQVINLPQAEHG